MYAVITTIKTEDGAIENSWSIHDTKEEAKTAFKLAKETPSLISSYIAIVMDSTELAKIPEPYDNEFALGRKTN